MILISNDLEATANSFVEEFKRTANSNFVFIVEQLQSDLIKLCLAYECNVTTNYAHHTGRITFTHNGLPDLVIRFKWRYVQIIFNNINKQIYLWETSPYSALKILKQAIKLVQTKNNIVKYFQEIKLEWYCFIHLGVQNDTGSS